MSAQRIDGKGIALALRQDIAIRVHTLKEQGIYPCLAVVLVGKDPASQIYVNNKVLGCEEVGIRSIAYRMPEDTPQSALLRLIEQLMADETVHGVLVQLPLPAHIDVDAVLDAVLPHKDVDGFHVNNVGKLCLGKKALRPCTPRGIIHLLRSIGQPIAGKHAVVVGRSIIVGRPVAMMLLAEDATVTICHSHTQNLPDILRQADILVTAVGKAGYVTADMVKPGAVVIDAGTSRVAGKLRGDVDFEAVLEVASYVTPVPGGVGPMTITMLLDNTVQAAERNG